MGEGHLIQGIIGGFLAIGGILLALISSGILGHRLSKRMACIAIGLALSGFGLFILLTSFPEYAIGFSVLATLALAIAAFLTIKAADAREERHRKESLLKDVNKWSADIRKYSAFGRIGFNRAEERIQQRDNFFTLKYDGKNLLILVEKENLDDTLQGYLKNVIGLFDGSTETNFADTDEKQTDIEKSAFLLLKRPLDY